MEPSIPAHDEAAPGRAAAAGAATGEAGIVTLVLADHARILELFAALENMRRQRGAAMVAASGRTWAALAELLEIHTAAEEEICYPVVFAEGGHVTAMLETAIADHRDIREAVEEAGLLETGSARWWRAVSAARAACSEHLASEEQGVLAEVWDRLDGPARELLARQWTGFVCAQPRRPS